MSLNLDVEDFGNPGWLVHGIRLDLLGFSAQTTIPWLYDTELLCEGKKEEIT